MLSISSTGIGDRIPLLLMICTTPSMICSTALVCAAVSRSLRPCTADSTCFTVGMPDSQSVCACAAPAKATMAAQSTRFNEIPPP